MKRNVLRRKLKMCAWKFSRDRKSFRKLPSQNTFTLANAFRKGLQCWPQRASEGICLVSLKCSIVIIQMENRITYEIMAHCQFSIYLHLLWQMLSNLILALLFYRNRLALLCYTIIIRIISPINSLCPFLSRKLRESFDDCKPKLYSISFNWTLTLSKNFIFDWNIS